MLAAACESVVVPAQPNTPLTPATHTAFQIATGVHQTSCNTCHGGFATFKEFTCFGCHAHDQAPTDALHTSVDTYGYVSSACYTCHQSSGGGTGGATPAGLVRDPGRDVTVNALVPSYAGTSIATLSPQAEPLPMPMSHASAQVPAAALVSCSNCHTQAVANSYFPGTLHSALANLSLPAPTGCSDCHATSRPQGLVGPTAAAPARTPPSGEMKHDAVAWVNGQPTQSALVTQDCATCHASPGANLDAKWGTSLAGQSPAQFHAALTNAQQTQPSSCIDCHANTRPTGVLTSANAALPATLQFDHTSTAALADCSSCHAKSGTAQWASWQGGAFHLAGSAAPTSCLPCHESERPTSTAGWKSSNWASTPFDFVANAQNISHGDSQDCASCHTGPGAGAWGTNADWTSGHLTHGAGTVSGSTCIACHMTQRPDLQPGATAAGVATQLGFDHSLNGTGNCYGCHQATVTSGSYAHYDNPATGTLPGGDWKGAQSYPGSTLVGSADQFITVTETRLTRSAQGLVTGSTATSTTLYNEMLHISPAVPATLSPGSATAPDNTKCWHCHTNNNGTVTAYANGQFHPSLTGFRATPGGTVSPLPQPASQCADCHQQMRPVGVVQRAGSDLQAMDHSALFTAQVTIGGVAVSGVPGLDCSTCHHNPGNEWSDGAFHSNIAGATPRDCTQCHYPLMADTAKADLASGTSYAMKHRSGQLTTQSCDTCHAGSLGRATSAPASTVWQGGAFHSSASVQPTGCLDCHAVSTPGATQSSATYPLSLGGTASNSAQWMSHTSAAVAGRDCAACHAADAKASGSAWNKSISFHAQVASPGSCQACHGVANGQGSVPGTNNNLPGGLTNSTAQSSASNDPSTGVAAGTLDQISHADVNVTGHDCNFCHTQTGPSTAPGVQGHEWAQAKFHANFGNSTPLLMNAGSGRCSNCHLNVKPTSGFSGYDHSALSGTSAQDCASCHSWPGTGSASNPNWLGAGGGMPQSISVGGFQISSPPASSPTTQGGINNLPHPTVATGTACTTCHATSAGGKGAHAYPHNASLDSNCNACHEAGTNLLGGLWNNATSQGSGAGDGRPFTLASVVANKGGSTLTVRTPNHFYPVNCNECHVVPSGTGTVTTGSSYTNAWTFPHTKSKMSNSSTCNFCH